MMTVNCLFVGREREKQQASMEAGLVRRGRPPIDDDTSRLLRIAAFDPNGVAILSQ